MNTPTTLLTIEAGSGCEILEEDELYEVSTENAHSDEIVVISGTITVSP